MVRVLDYKWRDPGSNPYSAMAWGQLFSLYNLLERVISRNDIWSPEPLKVKRLLLHARSTEALLGQRFQWSHPKGWVCSVSGLLSLSLPGFFPNIMLLPSPHLNRNPCLKLQLWVGEAIGLWQETQQFATRTSGRKKGAVPWYSDADLCLTVNPVCASEHSRSGELGW